MSAKSNQPVGENEAPPFAIRFFDGLIEAVWLAAVALVPLISDPRSGENGFEFMKYSVIRSLACLGLAAWIARSCGARLAGAPAEPTRSPGWRLIVLAAFGLALCTLVSSIFSVYPYASFWGEADWHQGFVSLVAELIIFLLVATHLRRRDQMERLVTTALVVSCAVAVCALVQRAGYDPLAPGLKGDRTVSTAGHPIFLSGYLGMTIPLTLWRLISIRSLGRLSGRGAAASAWALALYGSIFVFQILAFLSTESRGSLIGLAGALLLFGVLSFSRQGQRRGLLAVLGVAAAGLFAFGLFIAARRVVGDLPVLRRILPTSQPVQNVVDRYRVDLWQEAPSLLLNPSSVKWPESSQDRLGSLRVLIGYGPEVLQNVLPLRYSVSGTGLESRFHNLIWDQWFATGLAGVLVFFAIQLLVWRRACCLVNILEPGGFHFRFLAVLAVSSVAGGALLSSFLGFGAAALGLQAGLFLGLLGWTVIKLLRRPLPRTVAVGAPVLGAALLAALVSNWLGAAFAYPVSETSLFSWIYAGCLLALPGCWDDAEGQAETVPTFDGKRSAARSVRRQPVAVLLRSDRRFLQAVAIGSAALAALLFSLLHKYSTAPMSVTDVLSFSLWRFPGPGEPASVQLLVVVALWLAASFAYAFDALRGDPLLDFPAFLRRLALTLAVAAIGFAFINASVVAAGAAMLPATGDPDVASKQGEIFQNFLLFFLLSCAALLFVFAAASALSSRCRPWRLAPREIAAVFLPSFVGLALAWFLGARPAWVRFASQWAAALASFQKTDASIRAYQHALALDPRPLRIRVQLALLLSAAADGPRVGEVERDRLLAQAEQTLLDDRRFTRLDRAAFQLGQLYLRWALASPPSPRQPELANSAVAMFAEACQFEPQHQTIWVHAAMADRLFRGSESECQRKLAIAHDLSHDQYLDYWVDYFCGMAALWGNPQLQAQYADFGLWYVDRLLANPAVASGFRSHMLLKKAELLLVLHRVPEAKALLTEASREAAPSDLWQVELALAQCDVSAPDLASALTHLERALAASPPPEQRESLATSKLALEKALGRH